MASFPANESDSDEYQSLPRHHGSTSSTSHADDSGSSMTDMDTHIEAPSHPIPSMQGAFEESIRESAHGETFLQVEKDAEARRHSLLEVSNYDDTWRTRWRQKSTAQHHPLRKLMAQIVFGMHLLQQQQAKSNEEVVSILQTHVNEVDGFLERTADDFELATTDIEDRIEHLRLPMAHLEVFEYMLRDSKFRAQLLDGNRKIEDIVDRTSKAMNATLFDIQQGIVATEELAKYMDNVASKWPKHRSDIDEVFSAMRGNEQGWLKYLRLLPTKGARLSRSLKDLSGIITEMAKMANTARGRERHTSRASAPAAEDTTTPLSPGLRSKFSPEMSPRLPRSSSGSMTDLNKPLPTAPVRKLRNTTSNSSPAHHSPRQNDVRHEDIESSNQIAEAAKQRSRLNKSSQPCPSPSPQQRPKTAGSTATLRRNSSNELAEFLKTAGPLRSNPPEHLHKSGKRSESKSSSGVPQARSVSEPLVAAKKPPLQGAATMVFLNSPHHPQPSSMDARDDGRAMSIRSAPGLRKDGHAFARRISARMKSLPFSDDKPSSPSSRKYSAPLISAPIDFRVIDSNEEIARSRTEAYDATPTHMPTFSKSHVGSFRTQSIRAPSLASTSRLKIRNIFQRGWKPRDPDSIQ